MRSGDRCESCSIGRLLAYSTKTRGSSRVTYCRCTSCRATAKQVSAVDCLGRIVFVVGASAGNGDASRIGEAG